MRTKFTKASQKDKTLVTVNLAQFDTDMSIVHRSYCGASDTLTLVIEGQAVVFKINRYRNDLAVTAVTHCFPRFLRLPRVGRPVFAEVTEVS